MNKDVYACFTDIAGSTKAQREQGNKPYDVIKRRHFSVLDRIADKHKRSFSNSTGDGRIVIFESLEDALSFAVELRFCCGRSSVRSPKDIKIRISIAHGPAEIYPDGNVSGQVVNYSARLNSIDNFENIVICEKTAQNIEIHYGNTASSKMLSKKTVDLKNYPNTTYYELSALSYSESLPYISFQKNIKDYLENLGITFSNLELHDLLKPNTIIWPVVPRPHVNLIHHGMIEILSIFELLDWNVKIVVADYVESFGNNADTNKISQYFVKNISDIFSCRNIDVEIILLSSMFSEKNNDTCCSITKRTLLEYIASLKLRDIDKIINKNYGEQDKISPNKTSWSLMRPFFTLAATININTINPNRKKIILSGEDELLMWEGCTKLPTYESKIGSVHLPILKNNDGKQLSLENTDLFWRSSTSLYQDFLKNNNMAKWAMNMIVAPSNYPIAEDKLILDNTLSVDIKMIFDEQAKIPDELLKPLARDVFNHLNSVKNI